MQVFLGDMDLSSIFLSKMDFSIFKLLIFLMLGQSQIYWNPVSMYGVRNLDMSIRFSPKSRPSERFPRPEMSQIKAEISLRTSVKFIFHKNVGLQWYQWIPDFYNIRFWANLFNGKKLWGLKSYVIQIRESIDIIIILHFYEK